MNSPRLCIDWNTYCGQHWRKPTKFTAEGDVDVPPESQKLVPLNRVDAEEFLGMTSRRGLTTPLRCAAILTNKFQIAYTYGENVDKVLAVNPTKEKLRIRKGTPVAEFHTRADDAYEMSTVRMVSERQIAEHQNAGVAETKQTTTEQKLDATSLSGTYMWNKLERDCTDIKEISRGRCQNIVGSQRGRKNDRFQSRCAPQDAGTGRDIVIVEGQRAPAHKVVSHIDADNISVVCKNPTCKYEADWKNRSDRNRSRLEKQPRKKQTRQK